jgi:hypothetical protein
VRIQIFLPFLSYLSQISLNLFTGVVKGGKKKRDGFGAEKTRLAPLPPRHAELDSASQI